MPAPALTGRPDLLLSTSAPSKSRLEEELDALDGALRAAEEKEQYGRELELLGRAGPRYSDSFWTESIELRQKVLEERLGSLFETALAEAAQAQGAPDGALRLAALRGRLVRWGLPDRLREFDRRTGAVAPSSPGKPPESIRIPTEPERSGARKAYLALWRECAQKATRRDYDQAANLLRKAPRDIDDEAVRSELKSDLEDLRLAASMHEEILSSLAKLPLGTRILVETRDASGQLGRLSGVLCRTDRARAELITEGTKDTVFVEYEDATFASLIGLVRPRSGRTWPVRTLALLCLLDGDLVWAQELLGGQAETVPAKYWAQAPEARGQIPPEAASLASQRGFARALFYEAEREYRWPRSRGSASEKYAKLAREYGEVPFVKHDLVRINFRSEPCAEYVFVAADWRSAGAFEPRGSSAGGAYWSSASDFSFAHANENFVEIEFYAFPGLSYRCWVRLGGCCAESFAGFYQVSDLVAPHPQKSDTLAYLEPGSIYAMTLNLSSLTLKPSHSAHARPMEPKSPALWAWLEIPLPRWKTPGIKRLRLMTAQQGFSVASAVVSSERKAAPPASEAKDLEEGRAAELGGLGWPGGVKAAPPGPGTPKSAPGVPRPGPKD
jgi:hypothetical protein